MSEASGESGWLAHPWVGEGSDPLRLGVGVTARAPAPDWSACQRLVQTLDSFGVDSFWQPDHPALAPDCWLVLAAIATHTRRLRLGPLVSNAGFRSPALLARHAADLDRLSGGRAILGLGAGWLEAEYRFMGLTFPPLRDRYALLRETIEIVQGLWATRPVVSPEPVEGAVEVMPTIWTERPFRYAGAFCRFEQGVLLPGPVQRPRMPVLIGGSGERVTLRLVARYADMANFEEGRVKTAEAVETKLAALRRHCDELGRPFETVLPSYFVNGVLLAETRAALAAKVATLSANFRTGSTNFATPDDLVAKLRPIVATGIRYLIVNLTAYDDLETAHLVAERVLPALKVT